jgi:TolA-binding protein
VPLPIPVKIWLPFWAYAAYFAINEIYSGLVQIANVVNIGHYSVAVANDPVAHWTHIGGLLLGVLAAFLLDSVKEGKRGYVLEDTAKAVSEGIPANADQQQLEQLYRERPNDPEVLDALAALAMANGEHEQSRDYSLKRISLFLSARETQHAAADYLSQLLAFPDTVLPAKEQLAVASALEGSGHYEESITAFELVIDKYPQTREAETALLRGAQIYQRHLYNRDSARQMLQALLEQYPDSPWENLARNRLREIGKG